MSTSAEVLVLGQDSVNEDHILVLTLSTPRSDEEPLYESLVYFSGGEDKRHEAERVVYPAQEEALQGHQELLGKWQDARMGMCLHCEDSKSPRLGWILSDGKAVCSELPYSEHAVCGECNEDDSCEEHPNWCVACSADAECESHRSE